jgi:hypothetical protein
MDEETGLKIVREFFPDLPDDPAGYVLWNETGFPEFWFIPEDGETPEECLRTELRRYKERNAMKQGSR